MEYNNNLSNTDVHHHRLLDIASINPMSASFLQSDDATQMDVLMHLASEDDSVAKDPISPMSLLIIFVLLGVCLTCLCVSLGYLIMKDETHSYDICFKSSDEDETKMRNMIDPEQELMEADKAREQGRDSF